MRLLSALVLSILFTAHASAQLDTVPDTNYATMVNNFILSGVSASNVQFTGAPWCAGSFTNGATTNLGLTDGLVLASGRIDTVNQQFPIGSPVSNFKSTSMSMVGYHLLDSLLSGFLTYDAAVLEFNLVPTGNMLEFQYVFASEEYPEFVGSSFNDVFGFFISGPNPAGGSYSNVNIARIPQSLVPVSINNVNAQTNAQYFVDNEALNGQTIIYDGFTTPLLAQISVTPGQTYHLIMAVADVADGIYDSGVFLKAQSMKSYNPVGIGEVNQLECNLSQNPLDEGSLLSWSANTSAVSHVTVSDFTGRVLLEMDVDSDGPIIQFPIGQHMSQLHSGAYLVDVQSAGLRSALKVLKP